jgi:hypothetical protein
MQLSFNFTLNEMTRSQAALTFEIDNTPNEAQIEALRLLCEWVLQPLRDKLGKPITVNSGYRNSRVNRIVGGAQRSQHQKGEAADIVVRGMSVEQLFQFILKSGLPFDQLIEEFDQWVHISFRPLRRRGRAYRARREGSRIRYISVPVPK